MTVLAFVLALAVLIAVHEYGHYRMAVACGVKVLRFSIGFGPVLLRWQSAASGAEFVVCALPLGGYVRMLDEREAPVPAAQRAQAFNTQSLRARALIVAAGPVANLALAVVLYSLVGWMGMQMAAPVLAPPSVGSVAQRAGLVGGERVVQGGFVDEALQPVQSFEDLRWLLVRAALQGQDVRLLLRHAERDAGELVHLSLSGLETTQSDAALLRQIGLVAPWSRPVLGAVMPDGPAARAGLREGDVVLRLGDNPVRDGAQLRELIRTSVREGQAVPAPWQIERQGQRLTLWVEPQVQHEGALTVGKIAAYVGAAPEMVEVRLGPVAGLVQGLARTWEVATLSLRMMGKMLMGEASLQNLSGPITIADYAGRSASLGLTAYLGFLAVISVSLGVLNLLPLPVLDGGHLMYYLWEGLTGREVPEVWLDRMQRGGVAVLLLLMAVALFNDLTRLWG